MHAIGNPFLSVKNLKKSNTRRASRTIKRIHYTVSFLRFFISVVFFGVQAILRSYKSYIYIYRCKRNERQHKRNSKIEISN